jgi:hypothetical protein
VNEQAFNEEVLMSRTPTESERKLADIAVQLAIVAAEQMAGKDSQTIGAWAASQLNSCGFKNVPMGSTFAFLTEVDE